MPNETLKTTRPPTLSPALESLYLGSEAFNKSSSNLSLRFGYQSTIDPFLSTVGVISPLTARSWASCSRILCRMSLAIDSASLAREKNSLLRLRSIMYSGRDKP